MTDIIARIPCPIISLLWFSSISLPTFLITGDVSFLMQSQHKQRLIITGRRCSLPYQLARLSSCFPIGWDILSFLPPRLLVQCWMWYPSPSPVRTRLSSSPFSTDVWLTREHTSSWKWDQCKFYQYKKNDIKHIYRTHKLPLVLTNHCSHGATSQAPILALWWTLCQCIHLSCLEDFQLR